MDAEQRAVRVTTDRIPVLHLGWWNDLADSLIAHRCDATFVVATADAEAPARHGFTGRVVVVPDPDRLDDVVAGLLRAGIDMREFDCVCSEFETGIVPAAVLAAAYGRTGLPVTTAVALRDKMVQKQLIRDAGIPVADCRTIVDIAGLAGAGMPTPFVVKPLNGSSTNLTYVVHDQESLTFARDTIAASGQHGPWLLEQFMEGVELHVDGVVRHGTVLFLAASRYLQNVIEIQNGGLVGSVTVDPDTHSRLYSQVHDLTSTSLKAMGHTDGVFHLEAFEHEDRLAFSECAGRIGGGMVLQTTRAKFGVDLYDEWTRSVLRRPSGISMDRRADPKPHGWVQLTARPGRIVAMPSVEDLRARPDIVAVQPCLGLGDTVPDLGRASNSRVARVVMRGETEEGLAAQMRAFVGWFAEQVHVE
jgi:phosphoribosylaminoimidazole carboxylase (NCAIR synthetase)